MGVNSGANKVGQLYVGNQEIAEAYQGSNLVYQNMPDYDYPPWVMNKGYTALSFNGLFDEWSFTPGVGLVYTKISTAAAPNHYCYFTLPSRVTPTNVTGRISIDGVVYDINWSYSGSYAVSRVQIGFGYQGFFLQLSLTTGGAYSVFSNSDIVYTDNHTFEFLELYIQ